MDILTQTITGQLDALNKNCIDWNQFGVIALANYHTIILLDSSSMKILNIFDNPRHSIITKLKWSSINSSQLINEPSNFPIVKLATGDEAGTVSFWNACDFKLINELNLNESAGAFHSTVKINDMKWIYNSAEYLLILFNTNKLLLWNVEKGQKVWTRTLSEPVFQFSVDPHLNGRVAFMGSNFIQFMSDCFEDSAKDKPFRKFFIMSTNSSSQTTTAESTNLNKRAMNLLTNWRSLIVDTSSDSATAGSPISNDLKVLKQSQKLSLSECIQIEFHSYAKDILFLVYPKEIFIFELIINQTIGYISLDRQHSPFFQLIPCSQRDALYILHDNGSVTLHVRDENRHEHSNQITKIVHNKESQLLADDTNLIDERHSYSVYSQSDQIRMSKNTKLFGFCVCPLTQKDFLIQMNDGRLLSYELYQKFFLRINSGEEKIQEEKRFLFDIINQDLIDSYSQGNKNSSVDIKIALKSVTNNSLPNVPFIVKMCPPLTKKNLKYWEPTLAIGCATGELLTYNLNKNSFNKKFILHMYQINGIEWASINTIITWSLVGSGLNAIDMNTTLQSPSQSSIGSNKQNEKVQLVKNEIIFTDIRTGESRFIRQDINEESPIVSIKISHYKQYMIILFKEQPFEIWDMKSFSLIKKISKKSPVINILEWCHSDSPKQLKEIKPESDSNMPNSLSSSSSSIGGSVTPKSPSTPYSANDYHRELLICLDSNNLMYSFSLEANQIKEGGTALPENGILMNLTAIAFKNDIIMFGDLEGNLTKWNIKTQLTSQMVTPVITKRTEIRKLKFAPGKENHLLIVQSLDNIEIIEANSFEPVSSFKLGLYTSKIKAKIVDCDWCSSDKLFVLFSNNYIQIYDLNFKQSLYSSYKTIPSLSNSSCFMSNKALLNINKEITATKVLFYSYFNDYMERLSNKNDQEKLEYLISLAEKYFQNDKQMKASLISYLNCLNSNLKSILFDYLKRLDQVEKLNEDRALKANLSKSIGYSAINSYQNRNGFESKFWSLLSSQLASDANLSIEKLNEYFNINNYSSYVINTHEFKLKEYKILKLYKDKRSDLEKSNLDQLFSNLILCNEHQIAFDLLLETDFQSNSYLNNYLKACLVSSIKNSKTIDPNLQSSIKLVATNLIANGKLLEGIELLCLVGLVIDACRYLQDNNQWFKAAWVAKMRLSESDYIDVIRRWSDHLSSGQQSKKEFAILLLLSCKQYVRLIEILTDTDHYELTYYFLHFCLTNNLIEIKSADASAESSSSASNHSESKDPNDQATKKTSKSIQSNSNRFLLKDFQDKSEKNYNRVLKVLE